MTPIEWTIIAALWILIAGAVAYWQRQSLRSPNGVESATTWVAVCVWPVYIALLAGGLIVLGVGYVGWKCAESIHNQVAHRGATDATTDR